MNSKIFFNIIDSQKGCFYPNCSRDIKNYESFSYLFDEKPATLEQTEKLLQAITKDIIVFDFEKHHPEVNSDTKAVYTTVPNDYFPVNIPIEPPVSTTHERFYSALISWECLRIKFLLRQYVDAVKDDSKARKEITNTLQNSAHYAAVASETLRLQMHQDLIMHDGYPEYDIVVESTSHIYKFLIQSLTKLYFEITIIFDNIIKRRDYLSIPDFYNQKLCNYSTDKKLKPFYEASVHIHKAQNICEPEEIKALLKELYNDTKKVNLPTLNPVITMLENKLYLIDNEEILSTKQLTDSSTMNNFYKQKRDEIVKQIDALTNPREIVKILETEAELLTFYSENQFATYSIPRLLLKYINEQTTLWKANIAHPLIPLSNNGVTQSLVKAKRTQLSIDEQLKIAQKHIDFLSGYNENNKKIMSDPDYQSLIELITEFLNNYTISSLSSKLKTDTTLEIIRYTFYLIYKELHIKKPTREDWVHFIHVVFAKFSNTEESTTFSKFSNAPKKR